MGLCSSYLYSFTLLFLLFHLSFASDLIEKTCKKSSQTDPNLSYNFCLTTLQAVPNVHSANLNQLGLISMKLIIANATHTTSYIQTLLNHTNLNPYYKNCLKDCFELYSDGISSLREAIKDFESKLYNEANVHVSAAMDAPTTCEDGFKEKKGIVSPLTKRNNNTFQLSAISLSIINMVG